jgi:hypothetical protein
MKVTVITAFNPYSARAHPSSVLTVIFAQDAQLLAPSVGNLHEVVVSMHGTQLGGDANNLQVTVTKIAQRTVESRSCSYKMNHLCPNV